MGFSCRKNTFFQAPIKLAQPFPAPELRAKKFTDTRIFLNLRVCGHGVSNLLLVFGKLSPLVEKEKPLPNWPWNPPASNINSKKRHSEHLQQSTVSSKLRLSSKLWRLKMLILQQNFGNGRNTVSGSTVSNTELSEFCGAHRVLGSGLSEFLSAYYLCVNANSPSLSQNSPSLPQNSVSSLLRNSTLETVFRPFPRTSCFVIPEAHGHKEAHCEGRYCRSVVPMGRRAAQDLDQGP